MSLTSFQKHYIKKNLKKLPLQKIADDLNLPENKIRNYLKKSLSPEKYLKIVQNGQGNSDNPDHLEKFSGLSIKSFLADNINIILLLFLLILIAYFNAFGNDFVSDDVAGIKNNPNIGNIQYVFSSPMGFFQRLEYFLIFKMGGLNPSFFRIPNFVFHFGSVVLVYIITYILSSKKTLAAFSAILMAVHPILIESVSWISGLLYVQYSFSILLSFLFYIIYEGKKKYWSVVFFLVALIFSEKAIVLPGIFFMYELANGKLRYNWKRLVPFFAIDFIFLATYLFLGKIGKRISDINSVSYADNQGLYNPLIQVPVAIANYFKLIFWPQKLSLYQTEMNFTSLQFAAIVAVFLAFLGIAYYGWKKNRLLFFWLSFFVVALSPTLTPFKISWVVAERYVYLGSIGIFVSLAFLFNWIVEKSKENNRELAVLAYSFFAIIVIAMTARTINRNIDWKNEDNLWVATAKVASSGPNVHNNLGDVYARHGEFDKAAEEFRKAIEINPNYADAYHNLANTYKSLGKNDLAMENYQKALSINPNIWQSYQNLAAVYYELGNPSEAKKNLEQAIRINPNDQGLRQNLQLIESSMSK